MVILAYETHVFRIYFFLFFPLLLLFKWVADFFPNIAFFSSLILLVRFHINWVLFTWYLLSLLEFGKGLGVDIALVDILVYSACKTV